MLGAADDFILELSGTIHKIITVASHPDNQVAVFFRVFLSIAQCFSCNNIELDMVSHQPEI